MKLAIAFIAVLALSCATTVPSPTGRWSFGLTHTDGRPLGNLVLDIPSPPPPCGNGSAFEHVLAPVVDKRGFDEYIVSDNVALCVQDDDQLYAELSLGVADHNLSLTGNQYGGRIAGDVHYSSLMGPRRIGTFTAERR